MSPLLSAETVNSPEYWDGIYRANAFPTHDPSNIARYLVAATLQRGDSALDLGCGQAGLGRVLLDQHAHLTYLGFDYSQAALQSHCLPRNQEGRWALWCGDCYELANELCGQEFGTVYLLELLEHNFDPEALLALAAGHAAERIVISVPMHGILSYREHRGEHAWDFTDVELDDLLRPHGAVGPRLLGNHLCWVVGVDR